MLTLFSHHMSSPSFITGIAKVEDDEDKTLIESHLAGLRPFCEEHGWDDEGQWSFRANFANPGDLQIEEGELYDLMRDIFPTLLDLHNFYAAEFYMFIYIGSEKRKMFTLEPHIVSMCASLGMAIDIVVEEPSSGAV